MFFSLRYFKFVIFSKIPLKYQTMHFYTNYYLNHYIVFAIIVTKDICYLSFYEAIKAIIKVFFLLTKRANHLFKLQSKF